MVFLIYIRNTCLAVKAEKIFLCLLKIVKTFRKDKNIFYHTAEGVIIYIIYSIYIICHVQSLVLEIAQQIIM